MTAYKTKDDHALLNFLQERGASTSTEIQSAIRKSQPTVSRLLSGLQDEVVSLEMGRGARYAAAQPIGNEAALQPIWMIDADGNAKRIGELSFLAKNQIFIEAAGVRDLQQSGLPWYLSTLRAQGFLGRILASKVSLPGASANPDAWGLETVLSAALHLHDAPGSILLGHGNAKHESVPIIPSNGSDQVRILDELARDVAKTLPAGSSAGGEQPKFLAITDKGEHVLVKFSPPRGTPFGDRWNDLLYAESICCEVLKRHGQETAQCQVVESKMRTYLLSSRFDRVGRTGRKHVVSVGAVHAAFVSGSYLNWASTCEALSRQGRLSDADSETSIFLLQFGRLTGNTDMHSGNLSLYAQGATLQEISKGRFSLAPVYDMLPMRWKPEPMMEMEDYGVFNIDEYLASGTVRMAAQEFWREVAAHPCISTSMKRVASEMASRIHGSAKDKVIGRVEPGDQRYQKDPPVPTARRRRP